MDELQLAATPDQDLVQKAYSLFESVVEVDLTLVLNDQGHSYEDTWCLQVKCEYFELAGLNKFLRHLGCDPDVEVHAAADLNGNPTVDVIFWVWKSEVGDLWGDCPELLERTPHPGMEFELPDHCDFGLL